MRETRTGWEGSEDRFKSSPLSSPDLRYEIPSRRTQKDVSSRARLDERRTKESREEQDRAVGNEDDRMMGEARPSLAQDDHKLTVAQTMG